MEQKVNRVRRRRRRKSGIPFSIFFFSFACGSSRNNANDVEYDDEDDEDPPTGNMAYTKNTCTLTHEAPRLKQKEGERKDPHFLLSLPSLFRL